MLKLLFLVLIFSTAAWGETSTSPWAHDSEASIVTVGGNTNSQTYSAKQVTAYKLPEDVFRLGARYLQTLSNGVESARNWDGILRYEHELTYRFSAFADHVLESDFYGGVIQRNSFDLGAKWYAVKSDPENLFAEAGYRNSFTLNTSAALTGSANFGRLFGEWDKAFTETLSIKLWFEYLPNFTDPNSYLMNYEPSVSVMLSKVFSLKVSYLTKYNNNPGPGKVTTDTFYSTALAAKL